MQWTSSPMWSGLNQRWILTKQFIVGLSQDTFFFCQTAAWWRLISIAKKRCMEITKIQAILARRLMRHRAPIEHHGHLSPEGHILNHMLYLCSIDKSAMYFITDEKWPESEMNCYKNLYHEYITGHFSLSSNASTMKNNFYSKEKVHGNNKSSSNFSKKNEKAPSPWRSPLAPSFRRSPWAPSPQTTRT